MSIDKARMLQANTRRKVSAFDELVTVLDSERATAVVDHRLRLRKPLTPYAARLLAGKFSTAEDPNAAADAMIANGWQGFEPDWVKRPAPDLRQMSDASSPAKSLRDHALDQLSRMQGGGFDD